jgi:hypothetical protein
MLGHDPAFHRNLLANVTRRKRREVVPVQGQELGALEADAISAEVEKTFFNGFQGLMDLGDLAGIGVNDANLMFGFGRNALGDHVGHMVFHIADIGDRLARMTGAHAQNVCLCIGRSTERKRACEDGGNAHRYLSRVFQNEPPL